MKMAYNELKKMAILMAVLLISGCPISRKHYCTEEPGSVWETSSYHYAVFSPDETFIIFVYDSDPYNLIDNPRKDTQGIYIYDLEDSTFHAVLTGYFTQIPCPYDLDISPDGEWLVFSMGKAIWKLWLHGDSLVQLTDAGENFYPRWSPDGKKIVYHVPLGDSAGIWMINSDGTKKRMVGKWGWNYPSWSPDGEHLIFVDWKGEHPVIAYADTLGEGYTVLLDGENLDIFQFSELRYSPNGTKILFVAQRPGEGPMVWVMDSDGSDPVPLAAGSDANWSPDGKKIIYASRKVNGLWIMDANGCNKRPLINDENFLKGGAK